MADSKSEKDKQKVYRIVHELHKTNKEATKSPPKPPPTKSK